MISSSPEVVRELAKYERMQIWITRPAIGPLADEQKARMKKQFKTNAIPLHVVMNGDGKELARYRYNPSHGPEEYIKFLDDQEIDAGATGGDG